MFNLEDTPQFASISDQVLAELHSLSREMEKEISFPEDVGISLTLLRSMDISASVSWDNEASNYDINLNLGLLAWAFCLAVGAAQYHEHAVVSDDAKVLDYDSIPLTFDKDTLADKTKMAERLLSPEQRGYCEYIVRTIGLVVFTHELAHILCGHVDYLRSKRHRVLNELHMAMMFSRKSDFPVRVLEYEADRIAARWILDFAHNGRSSLPVWSRHTVQGNTAHALWAFAMFTLAIEESARVLGNYASDYPSPMLRFTILLGSLRKGWIDLQLPDDFEENIAFGTFQMLEIYEPAYPVIGHFREYLDEEWRAALHSEIDELTVDAKSYAFQLDPFRIKRGFLWF